MQTKPRRLNFGCGYDKREGYLNVDSDPACEPDVLLVDHDLSVLDGEPFDEILALDVLEHIPRVQTIGVLLDWARLLRPGGRLIIKTSSIEGVARQLAIDPSFRQQYGWTHCLFGTQAHPGDFHFTGFTDITLRVHLLAAGFDVERIWLTDKWLLNAEATKSSSWNELANDLGDDDAFVHAAYSTALGRDATEDDVSFCRTELSSGRLDRVGVLRHVMSSPERLFATAARTGHEPTPPPDRIAAALGHVPSWARPYVSSGGRAARRIVGRAKRAAGRRSGRQSSV